MTKIKLAGLGLTAIIAVGCGGSDVAVNPVTPLTNVRAVHASRDAGNIDVFVNQTRIVANAGFQAASSFVTPPAGDVRVQVTPANNPNTVVIDALQTFQAGLRYTVLAVGSLTANPSTLSQVTVVDNSAAPDTGNFKVRIVHGTSGLPGNGNVDIRIAPAGSDFPDQPTFANVPFRGQAPDVGQPAVQLPAGNYRILVTAAGSENTLFFNQSTTFNAGDDLILTAIPAPGVNPDPELELLQLKLDSTTSIIQNTLI